MSKEVFASGETAQQLGMSREHLLYLIDKKLVPGPSFRVPGRRLFTPADIERISEVLCKHPDLKGS